MSDAPLLQIRDLTKTFGSVEALTDVLMLYHVTEEYDPADPDEHEWPWDDPRVVELWSTKSPILSERDAIES